MRYPSRNIDEFGDAASRTDERPVSFVRPFSECQIRHLGLLALGFTFAKHSRMRFRRVIFGREFAFALAADPTEAVVVKIVNFEH